MFNALLLMFSKRWPMRSQICLYSWFWYMRVRVYFLGFKSPHDDLHVSRSQFCVQLRALSTCGGLASIESSRSKSSGKSALELFTSGQSGTRGMKILPRWRDIWIYIAHNIYCTFLNFTYVFYQLYNFGSQMRITIYYTPMCVCHLAGV